MAPGSSQNCNIKKRTPTSLLHNGSLWDQFSFGILYRTTAFCVKYYKNIALQSKTYLIITTVSAKLTKISTLQLSIHVRRNLRSVDRQPCFVVLVRR